MSLPLFDTRSCDPLASGLPVHFIERTVYDLIAPHVGHANPITIEAIGNITGLSERSIKGAVAELVTTHGVLIGGSRGTKEAAGYFIIDSDEDRAIAAEPYKSQILCMLKRLRVLNGKRQIREWLGQFCLEDEKG